MSDDLVRDVSSDVRVAAALAVLKGFPISIVADQQAVPVESVERWVEAFVRGGAARVAGTADPDPTGSEGRLVDLVLRELDGVLPILISGERDLIEQAAAAISHLVAEVRDTADLLFGRMRLSVAPINLSDLVVRTAEDPRLQVLVSDVVTVVADPSRVATALHALYDTALREGRPGEPVAVRINAGVPDRVEVLVEHAGAITPARARRLLEPFAVEGVDGSTPPAGTGVALYLARSVAVAHGGLLALDLEDDGSGGRSVYRLRLPLAGPAASPLVERIPLMRYTLACGDVMPGCAQTFEAGSVDELLAEVVPHAAADHGITEITPEIAEAVTSKIQSHDS